jgi:hypothetical protein
MSQPLAVALLFLLAAEGLLTPALGLNLFVSMAFGL